MDAREIHELTRKITEGLAEKFRIRAIVGIYAANSQGQFADMRAALQKIVAEEPAVEQVHGFYGDTEDATVYFDMVVDFSADGEAVRDAVVKALSARYPAYSFDVVIDTDYEE